MAPPPQQALIWRRADFSESSRVVTLVTREEGKVTALAKGAHRPSSPFLGRLDLLNLVVPHFARRRGPGLRLLRSVTLVHEFRGLRSPRRFTTASYLVEIFDVAFVAHRADPPLFDLLVGALRVLERCPEAALPTAVLGVELRFLDALGLLPDLGTCGECDGRGPLYLAPRGHGLLCPRHRSGAARPVPASALAWLRQLMATPARHWARLPPPERASPATVGSWIAAVLERRSRWRTLALQPAERAAAASR